MAENIGVGERLNHNSVKDGDKRRRDLHDKFEVRAQRRHIVHHAQHHDDHSAEKDALHLMVDVGKEQNTDDKAEKNGETAKPRHGLFVHAAVVLRYIDRADLIGKRFHERTHQKADHHGHEQSRAHDQ